MDATPAKPQFVLVEPGASARLNAILDQLQVNRPFLVLDQSLRRVSPPARQIEKELQARPLAVFTDFPANPNSQSIQSALRALSNHEADGVVAVGGGTAIDIAKLAATLARQEASLDEIIDDPRSLRPIAIPMVALPSTAGTGSEATSFAVLYRGATKFSIGHPQMRPSVALVDPRLTDSCPPRLTASAGLDALSQAIESFWAIAATEESQADAMAAAETVLAHLPKAVQSPDPTTRNALAEAAYRAGKAINISKTTAPHAISYALTARYGIAHGHAVAITLGDILLANATAPDSRILLPGGRAELDQRINRLLTLLDSPNPTEARDRLRNLLTDLRLENKLRDLNVPRDDLPSLALATEPARLSNNPVHLTTTDIQSILDNVW